MVEYALLGLLLMLTLRAYTRRIIAFSGWPLLFGLGVAVLDETYQLFVPDRAGLVSDVALDFISALAGMAVAVAALALYQAVFRKKREGGVA